MPQHLIALRKHGDVSKLDFEDGLRAAVHDRLDNNVGVHQIAVDLCAIDQAGIGTPHPSFDALMWVDRDDDDISLDQPVLLDVALPVGSWKIDTTDFVAHHESWVGKATPGVRVLYLMSSLPAQPTLRELLDDATARMAVGALTCHDIIEGPAELVAAVSFWFPRPTDLDEATKNAVFERFESASWHGERAERILTFERIVREHPAVAAPAAFSEQE
jgi:hypothetical protein